MTNSLAKKFFASAVALSSVFMGFTPMAAHAVTAGEVYKTTDGTVWFINADMKRQPFTSAGAFQSYGFLSFGQVMNATAEVTALPQGSFIAPQDGKIFCATATKGSDVAGECALITGGQKAAFTSASVFTGLGFSFSRANYGDSSFLTKTSNIDNATAAHRAGVLINIDGTVYLVGSTTLMGIPSVAVFESWGYSFADVVVANAADRAMAKGGIMASRTPGLLSPVTTTTPGGNTGDLEGGAGDVTITLNSTYSAEDVGEGASDVEVMSFDVEADDGSDVRVTSVKIELQQTVGTNSEDITDYLSEVGVYMGSTLVGEADTDEFTESSDRYSKSITLSNAVVRAGETEEFVVKVTALDNLDSADIDDDAFDVELDSLRFIDAEGVTTTETPAADAIDQAFDVDTFSTANDVELIVALNEDEDDINDAHVINVDDADDTDEAEVLAFTLEAGDDSDVNVEELAVNVDVTGAANVDDMITGISLWDGDTKLDSAVVGSAVGADETYTFEDLDIDVEAGEMVDLMIKVDFKSTGDVDLDAGDTIAVQISATEADLIEATDETGEDLGTGDLTGTAVGSAHEVRDIGMEVELVSVDADISSTSDGTAGVSDAGTFTITFDVTAFDGDVYIDKTAPLAAGGSGESDLGVTGTGTVVATISSPTGATEGTNGFLVDEGTTERFTVTTNITATASGFFAVELDDIVYALTDIDGNLSYDFNLDDFKTGQVFLRDF
jgi:hypothetical protein